MSDADRSMRATAPRASRSLSALAVRRFISTLVLASVGVVLGVFRGSCGCLPKRNWHAN